MKNVSILKKKNGVFGNTKTKTHMRNRYRRWLLTIKKKFPRANIQECKGSRTQNFVYCSKDGLFETNITPKMLNKGFKEPRLTFDDWLNNERNLIHAKIESGLYDNVIIGLSNFL